MATFRIFCVQKSTKRILHRDFSAFRYPIIRAYSAHAFPLMYYFGKKEFYWYYGFWCILEGSGVDVLRRVAKEGFGELSGKFLDPQEML